MCQYDDCSDCSNMRCIKGAVRGVMDADPDEYYCDVNPDYFCGDREYDEDGEELHCPNYSNYTYEDYLWDDGDRKYDEMRDEGLL